MPAALDVERSESVAVENVALRLSDDSPPIGPIEASGAETTGVESNERVRTAASE